MTTSSDFCIVYTTVDNEENANKLAKALCQNRLAACVQIDKVLSHYRWNDDFCCEAEFRLTIKTSRSLYNDIESFIKSHHPYQLPQIVAVNLGAASVEYISWLRQSLVSGS